MECRDSKKFSCESVDEFLKGLIVKGVVQSWDESVPGMIIIHL